MRSPQCEDGYTKIANELLEAICRLHLSGNQWKVLHAIIRQTYGWHRKADWISGSQIAEITGLHRSRVCEALQALQRRRVILRDGRLTGIQKDYTAWLDVTQTSNNGNVTENRAPVTQNRNEMLRKSRHTKDKRNYTKDRGAPTEIHPAVEIYAELTGKKPRHGSLQYDRIARTVGDRRDKLKFWRQVVEGWLLSDYKPTNVRGMLEWFMAGKIGQQIVGPTPDEENTARRAKAELKAYYKMQEALRESEQPIDERET